MWLRRGAAWDCAGALRGAARGCAGAQHAAALERGVGLRRRAAWNREWAKHAAVQGRRMGRSMRLRMGAACSCAWA